MRFVDFLYRIKQELDLKHDKDVADFLELDTKAFSARKSRDSVPEKHLRAALAKHPEIKADVDYILTGKRKEEAGGASENDADHLQQNTENLDYVGKYDEIQASAGYGTIVYDDNGPSSYMAFRKDWLRQKGLYARNLSIVIAHGDSMEPTISDGDSLLVNHAENIPKDGKIYIIRSSDTLWVKRIQRQLDGTLLLISDNSFYPPVHLNLKGPHDIAVIGQVVNVFKDL